MANHANLIRQENWDKPVTRRGRRFIEFDLGDGRYQYVATIDPLHKRGSEIEIDATWYPDTGAWQWKIGENDWQAHARDVFNVGSLVEWRHESGEWVIVDPQSINWVNQDNSRQQIAIKQAVVGTANDATLTFTDAYGTDRHFSYTAHPRRLIKHFTLDSNNLPAPTVTGTIHFEVEWTIANSSGVDLYLDGVRWARANNVRVRTGKAIEFRAESNGEVLWYADAPMATDTNGDTIACEYEVMRQGAGYFIRVRVAKSWLDGAAYPVVIDPTFTDGYGGDVDTGIDTYTFQPSPDNNYATATEIRMENFATEYMRGLIKFDLSSLSGATITSANLYLYNLTTTQTSKNFAVNAILSANSGWTEAGAKHNYSVGTTRWAGDTGSDGGDDAGCGVSGTDFNAAAMGTWTTGDLDASGTEYNVSLNAAQVEAWITANYGAVLRMATSSSSSNSVASSDNATTGYRPKLVVVYETGGGPTEETASAARYLAASAAGQIEITHALSVSRVDTITVTENQIVNEAISLNRVIRCAQPLGNVGTITLSRAEGVSADSQLDGQDAVNLDRVDGLSVESQAAVGDALSIGRAQGVAAAGGLVVEESVTLSRSLAAAATGDVIYEAAVSLSRVLAVTEADQADAQELISLARSQALSVASLVEAQDTVTLTRNLAAFASAGAGITEESLTLSRQSGVSLAGSVVLGDAVSLGRALGITASGEKGATEEAVSLGRGMGMAAGETPVFEDELVLELVRAVGIGNEVVAGNTIELGRLLAAVEAGQGEVGESVSLGRILAVTLDGYTYIALVDLTVQARSFDFTVMERNFDLMVEEREIGLIVEARG